MKNLDEPEKPLSSGREKLKILSEKGRILSVGSVFLVANCCATRDIHSVAKPIPNWALTTVLLDRTTQHQTCK